MKLTNAITTPVVVPTEASSLQDTDVHHVMILKHGITGNHKEMGYVKESLERHFQHDQGTNEQQTAPSLLVHSATCNDHNSLDGIQRGGLRLATEINTVLRDVATNIVHEQQQQQYTKTEGNTEPFTATSNSNSTSTSTSTSSIALSIIGNSMGGLYARYALKYIDWIVRVEVHNTTTTTTTTTMNNADDDEGFTTTTSLIEIPVIPNIFVTTATPHLGVHGMTYWNVPACIVPYVGRFLGQSVADLFRQHEARPALPAAAKTTTEDGSSGGNTIPHDNDTVPSHYDIMEDDEDAAAAATDEEYKTTTEESRYHDILEQMTFDPAFLDPLARFKRRIAYANAYSTDIAVSTETAAFISDHEAHTAIGHDEPTVPASSTATTTNPSYLSSLWNCYYAKRHNRMNDEAEDEKDDDDDITSQSSMDPAASLLLPVHVIADDDIEEEEAQHNEVGESAPSSHFFVAGNESNRTSLEEEELCTHDDEDANHRNTMVVDDVKNTAADHDTSISVPAYSSIRFDTPKSTTSTKRYTNTHDVDREASSISDAVPSASASASELATNLDSLGWTKYFVDNRSLIPSLSWKTPRPNLNRGNSWDGDVVSGRYTKCSKDTTRPTNTSKRRTNSLCYSSSELKKQFCPNVWDWTTLPFGHSFLIASTRDQIHEMLYKTARPFVDEVIVKEVLKEMLDYN